MINSQRNSEGAVEEVAITAKTIGITTWKFLYLSFLSILLGLIIGLLSAFISK